MNYSEVLLQQIRELNREAARYSDPATPEDRARRDALLQALAWYVHKLQMRVLQTPHMRVSPAAIGYLAGETATRAERSRHAGAR